MLRLFQSDIEGGRPGVVKIEAAAWLVAKGVWRPLQCVVELDYG